MARTYTNPDDINTLEDLMKHRNEVKSEYLQLANSIKSGVRHKVENPLSLFKKKNDVQQHDRQSSLKKTAGNLAVNLVKKILPTKMGFLKKAVVGFFVKKTVKKLLDRGK